ncbi:MAG: DUF4143 domain-containing protein [Candidatus Cloacimonadales bacterium]|nr:DUF4143 domain-containing protein [Candidatus Cloacimonadales bacterium]
MIFRDIVERYNISNPFLLRLFIKRILSTITSEFSVNKLYNDLKSQGITVSKNTLYQFLDYCQDCFLFFPVYSYQASPYRRELSNKKLYIVDSGLLNAVSFSYSDDWGKLLENQVYLELRRRYPEIYYLKNGFECNFVCLSADGERFLYQVTYHLQTESAIQREVNSLLKAADKLKVKETFILTMDQEQDLKINGKSLQVLPVWKWSLIR